MSFGETFKYYGFKGSPFYAFFTSFSHHIKRRRRLEGLGRLLRYYLDSPPNEDLDGADPKSDQLIDGFSDLFSGVIEERHVIRYSLNAHDGHLHRLIE